MSTSPRLIAAALSVALSLPAVALTLAPTDSGTISAADAVGISHDAANATMALSSISFRGLSSRTAAYALFELPATLPEAGGLVLRFDTSAPNGGTGQVRIGGVTSAAAAFQVSFAGTGPTTPTPAEAAALFADVNGDMLHGSLDGISDGSHLFMLPATTLAAFNAARGGMFGIDFSLGSFSSSPGFPVGFAVQLSQIQLEVSPVPEPGTWALWLAGLVALAARPGRMKRQPN